MSFLPGLSSNRRKQTTRKPQGPLPPSNNHIPRDPQRDRLNRIFDQYKGFPHHHHHQQDHSYVLDHANVDDIMNVEGTIQYFEAINLDPEEAVVLALAYQLDSPSLGVFKRHGFVEGWRNLG
jgi:hypothetical protein